MSLFKDSTHRRLIGFGIIFYLAVGIYFFFKVSGFWGGIVLGVGFADITISNFLIKRWGKNNASNNSEDKGGLS